MDLSLVEKLMVAQLFRKCPAFLSEIWRFVAALVRFRHRTLS
jgi:hypothetical protein